MKRKRRKKPIVPRLGPATNLRPAGAHESLKRYNRKRAKAALKRDEDGFFAGITECIGGTNVSRFPAELTVTLTTGRTITECFNQAEMANFMRAAMLERIRTGEPLVVFDNEEIVVPAEQVVSVHVVVQDLVSA